MVEQRDGRFKGECVEIVKRIWDDDFDGGDSMCTPPTLSYPTVYSTVNTDDYHPIRDEYDDYVHECRIWMKMPVKQYWFDGPPSFEEWSAPYEYESEDNYSEKRMDVNKKKTSGWRYCPSAYRSEPEKKVEPKKKLHPAAARKTDKMRYGVNPSIGVEKIPERRYYPISGKKKVHPASARNANKM